MIFKSFELNKINLTNVKFLLFYGLNEGAKEEAISSILKKTNIKEIIRYEEKQILENDDLFFNEVLSKSLFDNEKLIIINRATDKIFKVFENIIDKEVGDINIIINSSALEKKSKLRNFFEKEKDTACVPFYADTNENLSKIALLFFRENNINISQSDINLLTNRCNGDRGILKNELDKIKFFLINKNKISTDEIMKLTNLTENHSINELINNCLAKNSKKTSNILNENNFSKEDCILIVKSFLNKSKKILNLSMQFEKNKNIDVTISSAKPPIFWKDKEITKQQLFKWSKDDLKKLIYDLNEVELQIKKNIDNSINLVTDFILNQSYSKS